MNEREIERERERKCVCVCGGGGLTSDRQTGRGRPGLKTPKLFYKITAGKKTGPDPRITRLRRGGRGKAEKSLFILFIIRGYPSN